MKITKRTFEEDQKLQEFARTPHENKPQFNWGGLVDEGRWNSPHILVGSTGSEEVSFDIAEVANIIGNALTNLLLSREEQDIFSEKNKSFVARISNLVGGRLEEQLVNGESIILSRRDINHLIEKALIEEEAFDVAKSLLFASKIEDGTGGLEDDDDEIIKSPRTIVSAYDLKTPTRLDKVFNKTVDRFTLEINGF